jgi:hypothetical protein
LYNEDFEDYIEENDDICNETTPNNYINESCKKYHINLNIQCITSTKENMS